MCIGDQLADGNSLSSPHKDFDVLSEVINKLIEQSREVDKAYRRVISAEPAQPISQEAQEPERVSVAEFAENKKKILESQKKLLGSSYVNEWIGKYGFISIFRSLRTI
jgi:hypothetical protein